MNTRKSMNKRKKSKNKKKITNIKKKKRKFEICLKKQNIY